MGGLNSHPYSHDSYQRQGTENIILRPVGVGADSIGITNFPLNYTIVSGGHSYVYVYRNSTIVDGAPATYAGPWSLKCLQINNLTGSITFGLEPGQTTKSATGSVSVQSGFLNDSLAIIPNSTIDGYIVVSESMSPSSVSGSAIVKMTNQNISFGGNLSGRMRDSFTQDTSSGPTTVTRLVCQLDSGYPQISTRYKSVNLKPMPMVALPPTP